MLVCDTVVDIPLSNEIEESELTSRTQQSKFILRVYLCLLFQLIITNACVLITKTNAPIQYFMLTRPGYVLQGISVFVIVIILFITMCFDKYLRTYRTKYLLLVLFSLGYGYNISCLLNIVNNYLILLTYGMTLSNTLLLTSLSLCTKNNNSNFYDIISVITLTFITLGILGIFIRDQGFYLFISSIGSILFSGFIIYDIKMITSNKFRLYKQTDFIIASINLYLDIINLFLYSLECLRIMSSD
jgi:FtsH-binding integral membrane protein